MSKARDSIEDLKTIDANLAAKAPLASPSFTGNVGIGVIPYTGRVSTNAALDIKHFGEMSGDADGAKYGFNLAMNAYNTGGADPGSWKVKSASVYGSTLLQQRDGSFYFYNKAGASTANSAISWTTAVVIDNTGQLQIGSPSTNSSNLLNIKALPSHSTIRVQSNNSYNAITFLNSAGTGNGSIRSDASSISYNTSSDYRLKTNVLPMTGATATFKQLKPCNFDWITGGNVNGFIAHELADVVPEAVSGTKDAMMDEEYEVTPATDTEAAVMGTRSVPDMQGIDQSKIVPLLTATIQELITRIEALEA